MNGNRENTPHCSSDGRRNLREEFLDRLPMAEQELQKLVGSAGGSDADLAFLLAANRQTELLRSLPTPVLPSNSVFDRVLERMHESIVDAAAARLQSTSEVDGANVAKWLTPLEAPSDVDWCGAVLDNLTSMESADGSRPAEQIAAGLPPTPGWLWLRIRGDLRSHRSVVTAPKRGALARWTGSLRFAAAAVVLATLVLVGRELGMLPSFDSQVDIVRRSIVLQRVDQPFASDFSLGTIVGEVRRGSR